MENVKEKVIKDYKEGKSIIEISKLYKKCPRTVTKIIQGENIPIRNLTFYTRKNWFNENYFEKIDSKDKAYFLGLLYADGNIYKMRNRIQITLQNEDLYILENFKKYLNSSAKLYLDKEKYSKLILDSEKMTTDLIKLGCFPNKSLTLKFPTEEQVPNNLMNHFIRGVFDGDGSVYKGKKVKIGGTVSFTSSKEFITGLVDFFNNRNIKFSDFYSRYKEKENSAGSTTHYENHLLHPFYDFIYSKDVDDLFLKRKKEKFDTVINYKPVKNYCKMCKIETIRAKLCNKCWHKENYKTKKHEDTK